MKIFSAVLLIFALSNASALTPVEQAIAHLTAFQTQAHQDANDAWSSLVVVSDKKIASFVTRLENSRDSLNPDIASFNFGSLHDPVPLQKLISKVQTDSKDAITNSKTVQTDNSYPGSQSPPDLKLSNFDFSINYVISNLNAYNPICTKPHLPDLIPSYQPAVDVFVNAAFQLENDIDNFYSFAENAVAASENSATTLRQTLNGCGKASNTQSCIDAFLAANPNFAGAFSNAYNMISYNAYSVTSQYGTNLYQVDYILMGNEPSRQIAECYGV